MNRKYLLNNIIGFLFVSILGTLCHFVYDWSGQNRLIGLFTPVNESTWEHMKLLFFPMILFGFFSYIFSKRNSKECAATNVATLLGTVCIPILFYTYRGVLGFGIPALDIGTFFVSVLLVFWVRCHGMNSGDYGKWSLPALILVALFWIGFFCFTYQAPNLGIFEIPNVS